MDDLDKRIIEILQKDASTPLSKVADTIGVPRPTVYLRFNRMKEEGVIRGFNVVLGSSKRGPMKAANLKVKDYLLSELGPRLVSNLGKKISERSEILVAVRVSRNTILVVWEGTSFDPREYSEVVGIEAVDAEIFKPI